MKFRRKIITAVFCFTVSMGLITYVNKHFSRPILKPSGVCAECNIILISVDSLRSDHVGTLGYHRNTTPNFDKLSKIGFLFENYFTTSYLTPFSEMSVHTGLYQRSHGVTHFNELLPASKLTLAEYLKSKNFSTVALLTSPEFEVNPALRESFSRGFDSYNFVGPRRDYPTSSTIEQTFNALEKKQFFLWLPIGGVHWPYLKENNIYADKDYKGYLRYRHLQWPDFQNIYHGIIYPKQTFISEKDLQFVVDQYDNGVKSFDDFLGELIHILKEKKILKNTIIIIQSEHGESLGEHGYIAHYDIKDTETHTPLLIVVPSIQKGKKISSFASPVDILPTIFDLLGDSSSELFQGKSLKPIMLETENDGLRNEAYMERNPLWEEVSDIIISDYKNKGIVVEHKKHGDIAIRTKKWKYILRLDRERVEKVSWWATITNKKISVPPAELYDITTDPQEENNLINVYPDVAEELKIKLLEWEKSLTPLPQTTVKSKGRIQPYF